MAGQRFPSCQRPGGRGGATARRLRCFRLPLARGWRAAPGGGAGSKLKALAGALPLDPGGPPFYALRPDGGPHGATGYRTPAGWGAGASVAACGCASAATARPGHDGGRR